MAEDPDTGWSAELYAFGGDNKAAFERLLRSRIREHRSWEFSHEAKERVPCTVEVSHRFESLHAHVRFNNGAVVYPGDEVLVHGAPVLAAYGEVIVEDRTATITRATPIERLWTRMTGDFGFMELCEFSFSEEIRL